MLDTTHGLIISSSSSLLQDPVVAQCFEIGAVKGVQSKYLDLHLAIVFVNTLLPEAIIIDAAG